MIDVFKSAPAAVTRISYAGSAPGPRTSHIFREWVRLYVAARSVLALGALIKCTGRICSKTLQLLMLMAVPVMHVRVM